MDVRFLYRDDNDNIIAWDDYEWCEVRVHKWWCEHVGISYETITLNPSLDTMDLQADKDPDQVQQGGRSSGSEFVCCTEDNAPGIQAPGVFFYESPHQQAMQQGINQAVTRVMSSGPRLPRPSKDSVDQSSTSPQESASAAGQRPERPQRNPVHRALSKWASGSR